MKKIDLSLLKRLVSELETAVATVESLTPANPADPKLIDFTVEGNKAAGLAAGIVQEAGLLVMDIAATLQMGQMPPSASNPLTSLLQNIKLPGSSN